MPPEQLRCHIRHAVEIARARRIGHRVDVLDEDHPIGPVEEMAQRRVPVEINLTSNDVILRVTGAHRPFPTYRLFGAPVAISARAVRARIVVVACRLAVAREAEAASARRRRLGRVRGQVHQVISPSQAANTGHRVAELAQPGPPRYEARLLQLRRAVDRRRGFHRQSSSRVHR